MSPVLPINCPKCGSERLEARKPSMSSMWHVACTECDRRGEKAPKKDSAVILWNAAGASA